MSQVCASCEGPAGDHWYEMSTGLVWFCAECAGCAHADWCVDLCDGCWDDVCDRLEAQGFDCGLVGEGLRTAWVDDICERWSRLAADQREIFDVLSKEWNGSASSLLDACIGV